MSSFSLIPSLPHIISELEFSPRKGMLTQIFLTSMKVTSNVFKVIMITNMSEKNMGNIY